jgi:CheY-like chemotaxis protein
LFARYSNSLCLARAYVHVVSRVWLALTACGVAGRGTFWAREAVCQEGERVPHTPWRMLVIDDEPGFVRALTRLLQRDGYVVETASNGRAGLAALAQRFDVIRCDLRMPDLDGRAFSAHLRQRAPTLCQRVLLLTGDRSAAAHQAFFTQCGRPWLDPPCPMDAIRRAIAQVLARVRRAPQRSHTGRALRQRSQALVGTGPTLSAQSAHWRGQAALRRGHAPGRARAACALPTVPPPGAPARTSSVAAGGQAAEQRGSRTRDRERRTPAPGAL